MAARKVDVTGPVIVRTYSAGVFYAKSILSESGPRLTLEGSRRIWRWRGANTCSDLALTGCDVDNSAISPAVPKHTVRGWIEILPCTPEAAAKFEAASAWVP